MQLGKLIYCTVASPIFSNSFLWRRRYLGICLFTLTYLSLCLRIPRFLIIWSKRTVTSDLGFPDFSLRMGLCDLEAKTTLKVLSSFWFPCGPFGGGFGILKLQRMWTCPPFWCLHLFRWVWLQNQRQSWHKLCLRFWRRQHLQFQLVPWLPWDVSCLS